MFTKVLSLFLAIQISSFMLCYGIETWNAKAAAPTQQAYEAVVEPETTTTQSPTEITRDFSYMSFASRSADKKYERLNPEKTIEIESVIQKLPAEHTSTLKNLVLDYDPEAHRGLGGKSLIILRAIDVSREEFYGVLIHEIGHTVDLGALQAQEEVKKSEFSDGKKAVYEGDLSLDFYRISWESDTIRKKDQSNLDFVSGYALTDPFEDFAESYVYFVLHNKDFQSKAKTNKTLARKYDFMKKKIFNGETFETGSVITDNSLLARPWDITVMAYDLNTLLNG